MLSIRVYKKMVLYKTLKKDVIKSFKSKYNFLQFPEFKGTMMQDKLFPKMAACEIKRWGPSGKRLGELGIMPSLTFLYKQLYFHQNHPIEEA